MMLDALVNWFDGFVDQRIYPVADVNRTGVRTYNIAGHECILKVRDDALCWIIYVHGNGVTLDTLHGAGIVDNLVSVGNCKCNVAAPAYPAKTQNGKTYDYQVAKSVASVYNQIINDTKCADDTNVPIYLVGRSLGVAVALQACEFLNVPPSGIVCISGFDCIQARIPSQYSALSCLVGNRFNNVQAIASEKLQAVQKLILHGSDDQVIPLQCAHDLYSCASSNAKLEVITNMTHNPTYLEWNSIYSMINKFIQPPEQRAIVRPSYEFWYQTAHK